MKSLLPFPLLLALSCNGDGMVPVVKREQRTTEDLIQENRAMVRVEDRDIELYTQRMGLATVRSGRGVHHQVLRDQPGATVEPGQWALVNYRVELLNGALAYKTEPGQPEAFLVEMDDVESGLHEAIQHLSPGDSAVVIIPSYRAHGLIGDMDRIPPRSSVVYWIGLVKVSGEGR
jgi:FKBP-type peptidyl-prolyl cis-trans isomerase